MSKRFFSVSLVVAMVCVDQSVQAADFAVATRDDVLVLTSKIQATQFLTHATFGANQAQIDQLASEMRALGTIAAASAWIDKQTNVTLTPPSLHSPLEQSMVATDIPFGNLYIRSGTTQANYTYVPTVAPDPTVPDSRHSLSRTRFRQSAWWHNVLAGEDQLRQKTAWALAQILSVGENAVNFNEEEFENTVTSGPTQKSRFLGLANYYDIFVSNAFGKYRDVIGKVTYHSIMGDWLSFRGNRRAQTGFSPDENYAREVMQLFTIGLDDLFDNGSPRTNAQGVIPTYDNGDISEYAQVFTGLGYGYTNNGGNYAPGNLTLNPNSPYTGPVLADPNGNNKFQVPMRQAPDDHDRSTKNLLNGLVITNVNGTNTLHTEDSANAEIDAALDGLIAHRAHPPFIVNRLIQRFVKSNPSKAYMTRVVNVFKDNGSGVRGDLKAVVKALLLDPEAWQPIRVQYQRAPINKFVVTTMGTEDSRLQEPVLTYTRFTRFFNATSQYQKATLGDYTTPVVINNLFRLNSVDATFDQSPYTQPSVFNFYVADYQPSGEIVTYNPSSRLQNSALFAPEFQIINAITANTGANFFRAISSGTRTENIQTYTGALATSTQYENSADICKVANESTRCVVTYNFTDERALVALGTPAGLDSLIERLDMYLCGGTLSNEYKATLKAALNTELTDALPGGLTAGEINNIARGAILSIVSAPSYLVTE